MEQRGVCVFFIEFFEPTWRERFARVKRVENADEKWWKVIKKRVLTLDKYSRHLRGECFNEACAAWRRARLFVCPHRNVVVGIIYLYIYMY